MTRAGRVSPVYAVITASEHETFRQPLAARGRRRRIHRSGFQRRFGRSSAEKAADTLDRFCATIAQRRLFKARTVNYIMDIYLAFVNAWYRRGKEFIEVFLNPTDTMQIAAAVNAVLAGNDGKSLAIKWRMWLFYFFVNTQRFFALSPRLSLVPKKETSPSPPEPVGAIL